MSPTLPEIAGRDTAANASRSLSLVLALGDVQEVTVVSLPGMSACPDSAPPSAASACKPPTTRRSSRQLPRGCSPRSWDTHAGHPAAGGDGRDAAATRGVSRPVQAADANTEPAAE